MASIQSQIVVTRALHRVSPLSDEVPCQHRRSPCMTEALIQVLNLTPRWLASQESLIQYLQIGQSAFSS